jgi:hypothetical protein
MAETVQAAVARVLAAVARVLAAVARALAAAVVVKAAAAVVAMVRQTVGLCKNHRNKPPCTYHLNPLHYGNRFNQERQGKFCRGSVIYFFQHQNSP